MWKPSVSYVVGGDLPRLDRVGHRGVAGVLGIVRSVALASMSALPIGVLKGTGPMSIVAALGLFPAPVPPGVRVLKDGPAPRWWAYPEVEEPADSRYR